MANSLPIVSRREEILAAVEKNPATIIVAETGAGKSTQVPQFLLDLGYRVIVTQPRRLSAASLAARVAEERGCRLGDEVGFRTARDREVSGATRLTYVTDGLQMVRELVGAGAGGNTVLVLDEVHEWNLNIEVLVAWAKRQVAARADFKVVLMSATLEAEKLAAFFAGAPVINVPGRVFPVEDRAHGRSMAEDVAALVREGRNVLAFQPGKAEINAFILELNRLQLDAEILPLHGELERAEQARVFRHYGRPKVVVATNVAQTSVTIDDIDAVVDSGVEKRVEVVSGVEGLYLRPVSLADSRQRKGRAGRTKAGIYIDHCPSSSRPDFPTAEVLRVRLDQAILRLAIAGFDMEGLEFFHQPSRREIARAKESLRALGCLTADCQVTPLGRDVSRLPVSPNIGVMCHAADDRHDPKGTVDLVGDILTIAAILEVGGIVKGVRRGEPAPKWRQVTADEKESDLIAQLNVWRAAASMKGEPGKGKWDVLREMGILGKQLDEAKRLREQLADALRGKVNFNARGSRVELLRAVCAGMVDHLFKGEYGRYRNGGTTGRELGSESVLKGSDPDWVVGLPFDLEGKNDRGRAFRLELVRLATKVDPEWLCEVAPHLARTEAGLNPRFDTEKDSVVTTTNVFFRDRLVKEETILETNHPEAARLFAEWLAAAEPGSYYGTKVADHLVAVLKENRAALTEAKSLNQRNGSPIFPASLADHYREKLAGAKRQAEVENPETLRFELDPELAALIRKENPDRIEIEGKEYPVTYGDSDPRISIGFEERKTVLSFPDEIRLASGRKVAVTCSTERYYSGHPTLDLPGLKVKVRDSVAASAFDSWEKPELPMPDLSGIDAAIPELVEASYGDGLTAFNAVAGEAGYWSSSEPSFTRSWFRSREEAETARQNAAQLLSPVVQKRRAEKEAEERQAELDRQVAAGEALVNFESDVRRSGVTSNRDAWVIRPDGSLRESEARSEARRYWAAIAKEELALRWYCGTLRDIAGTSEFTVAKLPVGGLTAGQLAAVAKIEEEIGAPKGAFGLDPAANKLREKVLEEARRVVGSCPACGQRVGWSERDVTPLLGDGRRFCSCERAGRLKSKADETVCIDNSQATLVATFVAKGGVFEVYRYYKYGCDNLSLRFREGAVTPEEVKPAAPVAASDAALAALTAKWGARRR